MAGRNTYLPSSTFLQHFLDTDVMLACEPLTEAEVRQIIMLMDDLDRSNRDWAAFLLSRDEADSPEIRAALLCAASDPDKTTRAEAIYGLARRDPAAAQFFVLQELSNPSVEPSIIEAAGLVAHSSLLQGLLALEEWTGNDMADAELREAIRACETGIPAD